MLSDFDFGDLERVREFLDANPRWSVIVRRDGSVVRFTPPDMAREQVMYLQHAAERERDGKEAGEREGGGS